MRESERPERAAAEPTAPVDSFEMYRCEPEAVYAIPPLIDDDPPLEISIAAGGGGGTVGRAYANNDWIYAVRLAGELVCSGTDLRSGGIPHTHWQMAAALADCLSDGDDIPPALHRHAERLADWGYESGPVLCALTPTFGR